MNAAWFRLLVQRLVRPILVLAFVLLWGWTTLALHYSNLPHAWLRTAAALLFMVGSAALFWKLRWAAAPWFLVAWAGVAIWWTFIPARLDRNWQAEVALLPTAEFRGDEVTVRNVRNFDFRSETDFTVRYEDRTYDLGEVERLDLFVSYWDQNVRIAHTLFSFGFRDGQQLCLSIEVRLEEGEVYRILPGVFKQYEIIYVLGDERDLIRLRTNIRKEEVYLLPVKVDPTDVRQLLVHVLEKVSKLAREPEFYFLLDGNCTTSMVNEINELWPGRVPITRRILMNGYLPEQAFENDAIRTDLPYEELIKTHHIDAVARQHDRDPDFSRAIREHLR